MVMLTIRMPEDEQREIAKAAADNYQSINQWCREQLVRAVANNRHNQEVLSGMKTIAMPADLDLIPQKRGKHGRFEKR